MNAPPAATTRDGAFLALALADALSLGLPDPGYITMHPDLARSAVTSAADLQFSYAKDPLPALHAWADRFGVTVSVSADDDDPHTTWHKFSFTHAGVLFHAYTTVKTAPAAVAS